MRKHDIETIIERHKLNLFKNYCEAESKQDPRMKIQNDGVAYGGANFIKYMPNKDDVAYAKANHSVYSWFEDREEIIYFDSKTSGGDSYGVDEFVKKRKALTTMGQHIKSVFRALAWVECDVSDFGTKDCSYTKKEDFLNYQLSA